MRCFVSFVVAAAAVRADRCATRRRRRRERILCAAHLKRNGEQKISTMTTHNSFDVESSSPTKRRRVSSLALRFEDGVPDHMIGAMHRFHSFLGERRMCYFCNGMFTARSAGALLCRFHPHALINRGTNILGRYDDGHPPPSNCRICNRLHISSSATTVATALLDTHAEGCTAVDHCASPHELFSRPFVAIPTIFLNEFAVTTIARSRTGSAESNPVLATLRRQHNVLLIHRARQLGQTIEIDVPGTATKFLVAVEEVYEQMAQSFGFESLDSAVREARSFDPMSRAEMHNDQYVHSDARRKDRLRAPFLKKALFVPFVVIARVDQTTPGSSGMKLV